MNAFCSCVAYVATLAVLLSACDASSGGGTANQLYAYLPMYEPGAPITDDMMPNANATYAFPSKARLCRQRPQNTIYCRTPPLTGADASFCSNTPSYVSRTPIFTQLAPIDTFSGDAPTKFTVQCGVTDGVYLNDQVSPEGTRIVMTTNRTLPDIYGPSHASPHTFYMNGNDYIFFAARCLEPNKHPSRIGYFERKFPYDSDGYGCWSEQLGYGWNAEDNHVPLRLPACHVGRYGFQRCDGQTVIEEEEEEEQTQGGNQPEPTAMPTSQRDDRVDASDDTNRATHARPWPFFITVFYFCLYRLLM